MTDPTSPRIRENVWHAAPRAETAVARLGLPAEPGTVRLADQVVSIAAIKQHPDRYASLFARARAEVGHAVCLCRADEVVRLVIRCRAERYHLATWPAGGHQHAPGCSWYRSPASMSGSAAYSDAIRTTEDGTSIRLSIPLSIKGASTPAEAPLPARAAVDPGGTARRSVGMLAMLHWLWEVAQLNVWHPQGPQRTWEGCRAQLAEHTRDCLINKLPLEQTMWIVPPFSRDRADAVYTDWERYLGRLGGAGGVRRRGLVLGEIRDVEPTKYGMSIRLAHHRKPLYATTQLMERARRSFPAAFSQQAGQPGRRQVVLCLIERSPRGHAAVVQLAAMLTTSTYIPADSSYEVEMADALAAAGRAFVKPLHFDGGDVFPDFVLVDEEPETYVEVWGVRGRELYEVRKRAKQAIYRESGRPLIEWSVGDPMPPLGRCQ